MMKACPECGSTDIIQIYLSSPMKRVADNISLRSVDGTKPEKTPLFVSKIVATVPCNNLWLLWIYSFYTKHHAELLEAYKKGYIANNLI